MQRLLAAFAILLLSLTLIVAWASLRLNVGEVAWQLQKQEFIEGNLARMYLVARFVDQRKLYLDQIDRSTFDKNEFDISRLIGNNLSQKWTNLKIRDALDHVSLVLVNALRQLVQKPPMATLDEIHSLEYLELAFRMERAREYQKALELYSLARPKIKDPLLMGVLMLHEGYCHTLLGSMDQARTLYLDVISTQKNNEQGVTASLLLQHLDQILADRLALNQSSLSAMEKAQKAPMLIQCKELLHSLDAGNHNPREQASVYLVRGLCEEESGNKYKAMKNYLGAIEVADSKVTARDANRRLYIMGKQINDGGRIKTISQRFNESLRDTTLKRMDSITDSMPSQTDSPENATVQMPVEQLIEIAEEADRILEEKSLEQRNRAKNGDSKQPFSIPIHSYAKVTLKNGKTFSGEVLSGPQEEILRLRTLIGIIGIRRSEITGISTK